MNHEEFAIEFANTIQRLFGKCPEFVLKSLVDKQHRVWEAIYPFHSSVLKQGFYFFIPVIPFSVISAEEQMRWIGGCVIDKIPQPVIQELERPKEPYFIIGVDQGMDFRGYYIDEIHEPVCSIIKNHGRVPCSDEEIVALYFHNNNSKFNLLALNTDYGGFTPGIAQLMDGEIQLYCKKFGGMSVSDIPHCLPIFI